MLLAVVALAVLASGCGRLGHADADQPRAETVKIARAVDGDTIRLAGSGDASRVRLIGEDTPETHKPGRGVECGGPQASASMTALLAGHRRGRLVSDPSQDSRDRYGRRLGYLEVAGRDVAETQIRRGWAIVYVYHAAPLRPLRALPRRAGRRRAPSPRGVGPVRRRLPSPGGRLAGPSVASSAAERAELAGLVPALQAPLELA